MQRTVWQNRIHGLRSNMQRTNEWTAGIFVITFIIFAICNQAHGDSGKGVPRWAGGVYMWWEGGVLVLNMLHVTGTCAQQDSSIHIFYIVRQYSLLETLNGKLANSAEYGV